MTERPSKHIFGGASAAIALVFLSSGMYSGSTQAAEWTVAPYLWGSDVGLDIKLGDNGAGGGTDIPVSDLLDKLDTAFMGHFEGRGDKWGGFFDVIYLDLSDSKTIDLGPGGPILGELDVGVGLTMGLYELGGLYRIGERAPGSAEFDILFGVRQVELEQVFDIDPEDPLLEASKEIVDVSETDVFLGGRILGAFNDRWGYNLRADYSAGGTDGIVNVFGAVSYTFGQTGLFSMDLGYRYMKMKFSDGSLGDISLETELELSGPLLGFVFNF